MWAASSRPTLHVRSVAVFDAFSNSFTSFSWSSTMLVPYLVLFVEILAIFLRELVGDFLIFAFPMSPGKVNPFCAEDLQFVIGLAMVGDHCRRLLDVCIDSLRRGCSVPRATSARPPIAALLTNSLSSSLRVDAVAVDAVATVVSVMDVVAEVSVEDAAVLLTVSVEDVSVVLLHPSASKPVRPTAPRIRRECDFFIDVSSFRLSFGEMSLQKANQRVPDAGPEVMIVGRPFYIGWLLEVHF